jgi:hypothetical protein
MGPDLFPSLPDLFSFIAAAVLLQVSLILFLTGRRLLTQVSVAAVAILGALLGEGVAGLVFPSPTLILIVVGMVGGGVVCYYLRPLGVGLGLGFLAFSISGTWTSDGNVQYVAGMLLFVYGVLLTDLAPDFVAALFASTMLLFFGALAGISSSALLVLLVGANAARLMAMVLPARMAARSHQGLLQE